MANTTPVPPSDWADPREGLRKFGDAFRRVLQGHTNNIIVSVTLAAGAASTTITDNRIERHTAVVLWPTTTAAATEFGAGSLYQTYPNTTSGQAVINHVNSGVTTRTFVGILIG